MDKGDLIRGFPGLKDDDVFQTSPMSPEDSNYNCIAWAYRMLKNKWMQPPNGSYLPGLDAVSWWPDGVSEGQEKECLKEAFLKAGFKECSSWEHEDGYIKVVLYQKDGIWTHAARECRTKRSWMSKLGQQNDICHKSPYTIEGDIYGKVYCIMKIEDK